MNLQRIKYFLVLCEKLHFSDAARQLRISQPALSKAIKQLEQELGLRLIRREGKNTHLTVAGESMRSRFEQLISLSSEIEADIRQFAEGVNNNIRVVIVHPVNFEPLAHFFADLIKTQTQVRLSIIDVTSEQAVDLLANGACDLMISCAAHVDGTRFRKIALYNQYVISKDVISRLNQNSASHGRLISVGKNNVQLSSAAALVSTDLHNDNPDNAAPTFFRRSDEQSAISVSQLLWARQLAEAGAGVDLQPGTASADVAGWCQPTTCEADVVSVNVVLPIGRRDNKTIELIVGKMKSFHWPTT